MAGFSKTNWGSVSCGMKVVILGRMYESSTVDGLREGLRLSTGFGVVCYFIVEMVAMVE